MFLNKYIYKNSISMKEMILPTDAETHLMVIETLRSMINIVT